MRLATTFERLLAYDRWANGEALASLEALREPPAKALFLLGHILGADVAWIGRMTLGRDPADWERWEGMDLAELRRAWAEEVPACWVAFLTDAALSAPGRSFSYVNFLGSTGGGVVEDALLTLMLHAAHHRGQVAALVREAGGTPAATELRRGVQVGAVPAAH